MNQSFIDPIQEPIGKTQDIEINVNDGKIRARVYFPIEKKNKFPVIMYYHGGGFVFGNIEAYDNICKLLSNMSGFAVVSTEYRLAPEYKFPTAVNDSYIALKYIANNGDKLDLDTSKIAVAGDSAGGNIAAALSLMDRDNGENIIKYQALFYPATNMVDNSPSVLEYAEGYFLTYELMRFFGSMYFEHAKDALNPYASPIFGNLSKLPPSIIITAQYDPLRDQGELFSYLLRKNGNISSCVRYNGMIHGFLSFYRYIDAGKDAIAQVAGILRYRL
jgi:acetyl esterase